MVDATAYLGTDAIWLVERLTAVASTDCDPADVLAHAERILVAVNMLRARQHERLRRLDERDRALGPTVELRDLQTAARLAIKRGDNGPWMKAWASVSPRTRRLVWAPKISPGSSTGNGFERKAPK